jgi:hypothetical protein
MEEKKKTVTKVAEGEKVKKTVKKVAEAAEPVEEKNVKKVETLSKAEEKSKATTLRIVSAILWVLAIGCEVLAILCLFKALRLPGLSQMWWMIIFIVADLGFCLAAGFLWKKASHLDPFSKKNKVLFFILTQLGLIMAAICFLPLIILVLASKDKLDKKSKIVVTVVACVALAIACLLGVDFNPISAEEKKAAENLFEDDVCWTTYGHKYHLMFKAVDEEGNPILDEDGQQKIEYCGALANSTGIYTGSVTAAIDNGCSSLCKFCANKAAAQNIDLSGINLEEGAEVAVKDTPVENQDLPTVTDGE